MDTIMPVVICFLSLYGIFHLLYSIAGGLCKSAKIKSRYSHNVIAVDDFSENTEAYVRQLAMQEEEASLIIINYTESKECKQILDILEAEFDFVKVLTPNEYAEYILTL